ncbi:MAG TPA: molecular chaperone [Allosphingosinicella sp.]|nr:molecular chaperone [Allosphingosinicella sp.]
MKPVSYLWKGDGRLAVISILLLYLLGFAATLASASSFQVDPVSIELIQGRRSASLSIRNRDTQPVAIRVRLYRWTQVDGADVHTETDDLIASPPIFTIPAGARQLIRIGPRAASTAFAYRIVLEEIPRPHAAGTGIQVALRVDLPLYVVPQAAGGPDLAWSAWRGADGLVVIEARNGGTRHSQVLGLATVDAAGRRVILSSQMGVVLPGGARRWNAGAHPQFAVGSTLRLEISNAGRRIARSSVVLEAR